MAASAVIDGQLVLAGESLMRAAFWPVVPEQRPMPEGTVTFLFSDVEGSTRLLEAYGAVIHAALIRHQDIFQDVIGGNRGVIFETGGDAVYAAFSTPTDALVVAIEAHRALAADGWTRRRAVYAPDRPTHRPVRTARRSRLRRFPLPLRSPPGTDLGEQNGSVRCHCGLETACCRMVLGSSTVASIGSRTCRNRARLELQHPDLRTEFPPLRSLDARRHNLPVQLSSFIGREKELAAVGELMQEHRLVTLLGPGGMGKTRLALQAAADQIDAFPDGAWFVDLSAVADAERIAAEIGSALSVREDPETPVQETLAAHLRSKNLLLVLDNLEQLLPQGARPVADLMAQAPEVTSWRPRAAAARPGRARVRPGPAHGRHPEPD